MYREAFSCDDILLVPRYSEIPSRSLCDPGVNNYKLPLMSAPMDKVYSPELDRLMEERGGIATVHRYFKDYKEQLSAAYESKSSDYRFFSVGSVNGSSKTWIDGLIDNGIKHFLVDMAHGDSKACVDTVAYIKRECPDSKIIAGNIATKSGFSRLEEAGAWAIRVGIGSGCFVPDTLITTKNGYKNIQDINIGDQVLTHTGSFRNVIDTLTFKREEELYRINDAIECTSNHEFYVVHKKYELLVNEKNIHDYAEWKEANELTEDYMIIEIEEK